MAKKKRVIKKLDVIAQPKPPKSPQPFWLRAINPRPRLDNQTGIGAADFVSNGTPWTQEQAISGLIERGAQQYQAESLVNELLRNNRLSVVFENGKLITYDSGSLASRVPPDWKPTAGDIIWLICNADSETLSELAEWLNTVSASRKKVKLKTYHDWKSNRVVPFATEEAFILDRGPFDTEEDRVHFFVQEVICHNAFHTDTLVGQLSIELEKAIANLRPNRRMSATHIAIGKLIESLREKRYTWKEVKTEVRTQFKNNKGIPNLKKILRNYQKNSIFIAEAESKQVTLH